ncbi:MAG: hypothetical protein IJC66_13780 [Kiritimatiellae bacterium]|nr:hypothetical protein [Kiritimatiellia bacterium]
MRGITRIAQIHHAVHKNIVELNAVSRIHADETRVPCEMDADVANNDVVDIGAHIGLVLALAVHAVDRDRIVACISPDVLDEEVVCADPEVDTVLIRDLIHTLKLDIADHTEGTEPEAKTPITLVNKMNVRNLDTLNIDKFDADAVGHIFSSVDYVSAKKFTGVPVIEDIVDFFDIQGFAAIENRVANTCDCDVILAVFFEINAVAVNRI